jgi:hypothetical protein
MKTEAVAVKPQVESSGCSRAASQNAKDAPADLFALLLSAAEGEKPALLGPVPDAQAPAQHPQGLIHQRPPLAQAPEPEEPASALALPLTVYDLKLGDAPEAKPEPQRAGASDAVEPGQWVSTVAKVRPRAAPPPMVLAEMEPHLPATEAAQVQPADPMRSAWLAGSTGQTAVWLAERFAEPESMDGNALHPSGAERSGEQHEGGQGQRGEPARVLLESAGQVRSTATEGAAVRSFATALGDAVGTGLDQGFEQLGNQISLWAAGQTRKASLMLHAGLREAIEVDVSLLGDKAELAFRTDDGMVREALRAHAHTLLADMLSQVGLGLESLSVDSRDAGESGQSPRGREEPSARQGARLTEEPAAVAQLLRQQPGVGLSVYA